MFDWMTVNTDDGDGSGPFMMNLVEVLIKFRVMSKPKIQNIYTGLHNNSNFLRLFRYAFYHVVKTHRCV